MKQDHTCLFEKIHFETYVSKKKETSIKITVIKTKEASLNTKSQSSSSLDPSVVV